MSTMDYLSYEPKSKCTFLNGSLTRPVPGKPLEILEAWANIFGLGISGSQAAFKRTLAIRQKIPVLIDPYRQIYFFPTQSPSSPACLWINAGEIKTIRQTGLDSEIRFLDGSVLRVPIGRRSLMKQWQRCRMMETHILRNSLRSLNSSPNLLP